MPSCGHVCTLTYDVLGHSIDRHQGLKGYSISAASARTNSNHDLLLSMLVSAQNIALELWCVG